MANEAQIVELLGNRGNPVDFTVANATGIEKGTLMSGADTRTALAGALTGEVFAGVAAAEKVAADGSTNLALNQYAIYRMKAVADGSTIIAGTKVIMSGANLITEAGSGDLLTGAVVGEALEIIADNTWGEVKVNN